MKIEQRSNGSYRVRLTKDHINYTLSFDHRPTEREVIVSLSQKLADKPHRPITAFQTICDQYVDMKRYVLSPRTIREYTLIPGRLPKYFLDMDVDEITNKDVQRMVNTLCRTLKPKTVSDMTHFVITVLRFYNPSASFHVTLPQQTKEEPYIPTDDEVKRLITYAKEDNPHYYVPIVLACWGLRRSEILGIRPGDLDGNYLHIQRAIVEDADGNWVVKGTKTMKSDRYLYIPEDVADLIRKNGWAYIGGKQCISNYLSRTEEKLGMKHFSLHKLRHYFASHLSELGVPDADILEMGGWSTDYVMKSRYRHAMSAKTKEGKKKINQILLDSI